MASTNSTVSGTVTFETDDDLSETNIGAADAQGNRVDYVERGCGFSVDHGANTIDIGSTGTRANYAIVENPSSHVAWHLYPDQDTDIALPNASATNHVFIAYDESSDAISYHIDDDDSAPSEPSLKIGTVDTANDTSTETNRDPTITTEQASIGHVAGRAELTSNQTISTGSGTQVNLNVQDFEDSDVVTVDLANNKITVDVDGTFEATAHITWLGSANWTLGDDIRVQISMGGTTKGITKQGHHGENQDQSQEVTGTEELSANDDIFMQVRHERGGDETLQASNFFVYLEVKRVG